MTGKKKHSPRIRKNLNNVDNVEEKPGAIRAFHVELLHKLRHHITGIDHAEKNHSNGRKDNSYDGSNHSGSSHRVVIRLGFLGKNCCKNAHNTKPNQIADAGKYQTDNAKNKRYNGKHLSFVFIIINRNVVLEHL